MSLHRKKDIKGGREPSHPPSKENEPLPDLTKRIATSDVPTRRGGKGVARVHLSRGGYRRGSDRTMSRHDGKLTISREFHIEKGKKGGEGKKGVLNA